MYAEYLCIDNILRKKKYRRRYRHPDISIWCNYALITYLKNNDENIVIQIYVFDVITS